MSREVPMLFSGHLVRAILDGRKTQTRRPMRMSYSPSTDVVVTPPCSAGDTIWVRETFAYCQGALDICDEWSSKSIPAKDYEWDCKFLNSYHILYAADEEENEGFHGPWTPSIHMPRRAARLFLEVTAVRAERVCYISEADAKAEGCESAAEFIALWNKIYPTRPANENFCWVIEFKRKEVANG